MLTIGPQIPVTRARRKHLRVLAHYARKGGHLLINETRLLHVSLSKDQTDNVLSVFAINYPISRRIRPGSVTCSRTLTSVVRERHRLHRLRTPLPKRGLVRLNGNASTTFCVSAGATAARICSLLQRISTASGAQEQDDFRSGQLPAHRSA